jgi:hypothetical protein
LRRSTRRACTARLRLELPKRVTEWIRVIRLMNQENQVRVPISIGGITQVAREVGEVDQVQSQSVEQEKSRAEF